MWAIFGKNNIKYHNYRPQKTRLNQLINALYETLKTKAFLTEILPCYRLHIIPWLTFQVTPFAESEPFQAAVCFSETEEDTICILSGSTEQQRGRRKLRVTLILYTNWHLHLSLSDEVSKERSKNNRSWGSGKKSSEIVNIFLIKSIFFFLNQVEYITREPVIEHILSEKNCNDDLRYTVTSHFIRYTLLAMGWTHFVFRTALIFHGIDSTRCWNYSSEILVHIEIILLHIDCRFDCGGQWSTVNVFVMFNKQTSLRWFEFSDMVYYHAGSCHQKMDTQLS